MIQDIAPLHLDNAYCDRKPEKNDRILAFHENMIYVQKEPELTFLTFDMLKMACKEKGITLPEHVYLFHRRGSLFSDGITGRYYIQWLFLLPDV